MHDFLIRAMIGGVGVALMAGPLGCFIVWKRMAYFGDALSHFALLGVVMGLVLSLNMTFSILVVAALFAVLLLVLQKRQSLTSDTALAILAHSGLAVGLVLMSFVKDVRVDMMAYLFGDILAISTQDIMLIYAGMVVVLCWLRVIWGRLLLATIHKDVAQVEGVRVGWVEMQFMLLVALLVALSIKLVGILLVTALLIVPAASARRFAATPEQMAVCAMGIGGLSVLAGLAASLRWDTPSGPSIVVVALIAFLLSIMLRRA